MGKEIKIIKGKSYQDERGLLKFFNDFDMSQIKRLYYTEHFYENQVRAWQAHKIEKRWFFCTEGSFVVKLVCIDNFLKPSNTLEVLRFELSADNPTILYIPNGYANGFKSVMDNSKLMIFSDFVFGVNKDDDIRYDKNKWTEWGIEN
ncbi:dTDP-4-dehydrorhamnose 3,5-epimerase family protein [Pseudotenacibaculum sp. MALMAid0570]|uniref:dTDP-4-dehydrorhamnose 3,5-epimerase family protein n=1 Tax=Pseudotenacibaculum sp. MALMAid0570 TaxID=3143938 RepID=UPI0032DFD5AF